MDPRKWSKRERIVAVVAGLPATVAGLILFRYVLPVHDYFSALFFGASFGIVVLLLEILAVFLARRFAG